MKSRYITIVYVVVGLGEFFGFFLTLNLEFRKSIAGHDQSDPILIYRAANNEKKT